MASKITPAADRTANGVLRALVLVVIVGVMASAAYALSIALGNFQRIGV